MEKIIKQVVEELHKDFEPFPFNYTSSEAEAQYRVYYLLKSKYIDGNIIINRSGIGGPVPPFSSQISSRIRIEWGFDRNKINDIVIFKENVVDPSSYEDVEAAIEIKSIWGEYPHLDENGFIKDFKFVNKNPEIGYFLIFIGNDFNALSPHYKKYYCSKFENLKKSQDCSFPPGHVYLIFRDVLIY